MRLRSLTVSGFRGFNEERSIVFHDRLTLLSAPNSHGKTSIVEALEFLLFGETSKVESADSRDEYKDSYRNRHLPPSDAASVELCLVDDNGREISMRTDLSDKGIVRRYFNGKEVSEWPIGITQDRVARPFVVQHALKSLLLAAPVDRFRAFAAILGLNEVDDIQRAIVSLCTKPQTALSASASKHLQSLAALQERIDSIDSLKQAAKALKQDEKGLDKFFAAIDTRAKQLAGVGQDQYLSSLVSARDAAAKLVYAADPRIADLSDETIQKLSTLQSSVAASAGSTFVQSVSRCAALDAVDRLRAHAQFLATGLELLVDVSSTCPFCEQAIDAEELQPHVSAKHAELSDRIRAGSSDRDTRSDVLRTVTGAQRALIAHRDLLLTRDAGFASIVQEGNEARVRSILGDDQSSNADLLIQGASALQARRQELLSAGQAALGSLETCEQALGQRTEQVSHAEAAAAAVQVYLQLSEQYSHHVDENAQRLAGPIHLLRLAIDDRAGTQELSALIRVLENPKAVRRAVRLKALLDGLKDLKKHVEQSVGESMESAFDTELTTSVMYWYDRIRTTGDPNVHFTGFAMQRTKQGDYKSGRVDIGAQSYGARLASAVSSLSESKLNALGLCVSIATAVDNPGPWGFIILDDPIQSWDEEHETRFIDLVRHLAEEKGKQVVLLSHRNSWMNQVASGCRSFGGIRYEITGYEKAGPVLIQADWMPVNERLRNIITVANDNTSTKSALQRAEEDVRIAVTDLVAAAVSRKLGRKTMASKMGGGDVRRLLTEMKCPSTLKDEAAASFVTTDDSHHMAEAYEPNRQRLREYHGMLNRLQKWADAKKDA